MDTNAGEILKQALSLPSEARAALADCLLDSLDTTEDEHARQQWLDESGDAWPSWIRAPFTPLTGHKFAFA